eukprot:CAMPEP_0175045636 /NCGR_PEP_ID=MMETSP0052_2-20121109/4547_1 /TAXON_ID=51329 ORGANISM="Polytomella parva, Strain SAG 63-3" /NCGR_SAMPLE_ID=MMETSP0052_2 /ASSEMBLY_ACC=CAM_ASM_000194 /LENGTH=276 /DNA_ID=CAMNT_0016309217 /DNA_START=52 /DNA_END=882 /DNA_ORIENTATION=+
MLARVAGLVTRASGAVVAPSRIASAITNSAVTRIRFFATNSTDVFNVHHDTPENNKDTQFDFTEANYKKAEAIMSNYPANYKTSAMIPLLDLAQQQNGGFVSLAVMNRIATILEVPPIKVYEVATFFTMFNRTKMGKYHVCICGTTPCRLQGAQKIEEAITKHLGVGIGQTTADGTFTLGEMECMGACVNAPMIAVADYRNGVEGFSYNYYEDLTPQDAVSILEKLKKGEKPKLGSQHRQTAEPAGAVVGDKWVPSSGENTLMGELPGPYCRDLSK